MIMDMIRAAERARTLPRGRPLPFAKEIAARRTALPKRRSFFDRFPELTEMLHRREEERMRERAALIARVSAHASERHRHATLNMPRWASPTDN